jgi:predicted O-linked N-acetylglucosamine transferase (SPINDLY family)
VERVVGFEHVTDDGSALEINREGVHILVNLGGYTSSARTEIFAFHPAPIQILLQGFAGTSGAPYLEYNVVDVVQAPPEHANFYSERMQLLPVSAFRGEGDGSEQILEGVEKAQQRAKLGLPAPPAFVAANLNRPFKLEPGIFNVWLSFIARTSTGVRAGPGGGSGGGEGGRALTGEFGNGGAGGRSGGAYFWMFRWPDALHAEGCLRREMASVSRAVQERVIFTNLLPHEEKIRGKGAADIFLDTPEYNAHGTATEVLSGGVSIYIYIYIHIYI